MKVDIEAEVLELFKKLIAVKGIEEKDILKIFESGNRIVLFPKDIAHLICKYTTKKHPYQAYLAFLGAKARKLQ